MIRGSIAVGTVAIVVSLLVHILGLSLTVTSVPKSPTVQSTADVLELNNSFEDIADPATEPIEPEAAEVLEPEEAEIPTSQALVASEDPQRVFAPDFGEAEIIQPDIVEPQDAEPADPSDSDQPARADTDNTQPVLDDTVAETPQSQPAETAEPTEAVSPTPPTVVAQEPEEEVELAPSEQAVTESIRPRLPDPQPSDTPEQASDGSEKFADLRFPQQLIESPLTTFQRRGTDAFTRGDRQRQSGGRGPGNSNVTNYAGQVLVHLNRTPAVYVPVRGFARVFFQIDPDGSLAWVEITDSSGSAQIDRAAKQQIRNAAPFPPPPGGVSRKLSFYYENG